MTLFIYKFKFNVKRNNKHGSHESQIVALYDLYELKNQIIRGIIAKIDIRYNSRVMNYNYMYIRKKVIIYEKFELNETGLKQTIGLKMT